MRWWLSADPLIKEKALEWLQQFIHLAGAKILQFSSSIIAAILPTLAYESTENNNILFGETIAGNRVPRLVWFSVCRRQFTDCLYFEDFGEVLSTELVSRGNSAFWVRNVAAQATLWSWRGLKCDAVTTNLFFFAETFQSFFAETFRSFVSQLYQNSP